MRFFTAFCNHWHCTCAMVLSLLCNHWQFLLRFSAMAKQNQNPKKQETQKNKKKTKWQDPTLCDCSPSWGVQSVFFVFLFLGFLVILQWLNKTKIQKNKTPRNQKKSKMTRPNSLPIFPPWGVQSCFLCFFGFFVFCFCFFGFLFFWFLVFWFVVGFLKG